ncbi:MAG: hypothetical protein LWX09_12535 [Bacteroidia bacterium]|nr:hypothetical protein [Bacteroidia bacterium]
MDKLTTLIELAIRRWTARSPRAYRALTDISLGVGIAATTLPLLTVSLPAWVVPTGAFLVALSAKLTVDKSDPPSSPTPNP